MKLAELVISAGTSRGWAVRVMVQLLRDEALLVQLLSGKWPCAGIGALGLVRVWLQGAALQAPV